MTELRIIFMGTPEFAVPSLEILVKNEFRVVAVVTAPDKPQGRGKKVIFSPVKKCALKYKIPILQPANLKSPEFLRELKTCNANLQFVVAFRMLPEVVWSMPALGTVNLHASLLPQYRGAAPINWAIINGEKETGVTTFFIRHEIDTGNMIFQEKENISASDTAGTLHDRLSEKGAQLVLRTAFALASGSYPAISQPSEGGLKKAPKIFKETCAINWNNPTHSISNFVRGLSPYPSAWTTFNKKHFKIHRASPADRVSNGHPAGEWITDNKSYLHVRTADGWLAILELQAEGKRRMPTGEFFRGNAL
jgi:methionyl-tRNA formyltransferase